MIRLYVISNLGAFGKNMFKIGETVKVVCREIRRKGPLSVMEARVLHEDEALLVVHKPAPLPTNTAL